MSAENREVGIVGRTNLGYGVHPVTDAAGDGGHDEPVSPVAPRWSVECQCLFSIFGPLMVRTPAVDPTVQGRARSYTLVASLSVDFDIHSC